MRESPASPFRVVPHPAGEQGEASVESADKVLARAAAGGDVVATRRLLERVAPRMLRAVRAVLGPAHADVDDVLQQALIGLVQALPSYRGECEPVHFGARIAVRAAMAARKRARAAWARRDDGADADAFVDLAPRPDDDAREARRRAVVRGLLEQISEEQAETMALRFMLGWSLEDVAQATGAPLNTVRSRLRLAKEALKKRIDADPVLREELEVDP